MPFIETSAREWIKTARAKFVEISGARNLFFLRRTFPLRTAWTACKPRLYIVHEELWSFNMSWDLTMTYLYF